MRALLGMYNTSAIQMADAIKANLKKVKLVVSQNPKEIKLSDLAFFMSVDDFAKHRQDLHHSNVVGIIFDCKNKLACMSNLDILDAKKRSLRYYTSYIQKAMDRKDRLLVVPIQKKVDVITPILTDKKAEGFLHLYNTLLYTITNKAIREPLRELIYSYMAGRLTDIKFKEKATPLTPKRGKGKEATTDLIALVVGEQGAKLKAVLQQAFVIKDPDKNINKLAQNNGVSAYDLRYFLSVMNKGTKDKGA